MAYVGEVLAEGTAGVKAAAGVFQQWPCGKGATARDGGRRWLAVESWTRQAQREAKTWDPHLSEMT